MQSEIPTSILLAFLVSITILAEFTRGAPTFNNTNTTITTPMAPILPRDKPSQQGQLTYYTPALGACGLSSSPSDPIVAISHVIFDQPQNAVSSNPNENLVCGKKIRAHRKLGGKDVFVDLTVVDRCTGCKAGDLDVSLGVFRRMADVAQGRVGVEWSWL